MTCGIYKIENKLNGHCYIGQSVNVEHRLQVHRAIGNNYNEKFTNISIYRAIYKHGINNFDFSIIEECLKEELDEREIYWIDYYNSYKDGYNQTIGGTGGRGAGKLSQQDVEEIKDLLKNTTLTQTEIGNKYGVKVNSISYINTGFHWYDENIKYPIRPPHFSAYTCKNCGKKLSNHSNSITFLCADCFSKIKSPPIPEREVLKKQLRSLPFTKIIESYGFKDVEIVKKWCDKYNLPKMRDEIKSYTDEEWDKL